MLCCSSSCCSVSTEYLFLIFVLVVCSPLLLLSGWFAGARTFVLLDLSFVAGIFRTLFFTAAVTCCICCVSVLFPNFCTCSLSPLLLLPGRTAGYFAGQSTAAVEILQSSAPGLVMVMMMDGNAAVAATATAANTQNSGAHEDDRLLCWPVYCCC